MKQTKKAQKDAVRAIMYAYPAGSEVTKVEDVEHLMNVFVRHPEWGIKQGSGVGRILVNLTGYGQGNRCFFIERTDGSLTDISFNQCIDGKSTPISDVRAACRSAIHLTITEFRRQNVVFGVTRCPISDMVLTVFNTHIDHYDKTFQTLFTEWIENKDVDYLYSQLNSMQQDLETEIYFSNPDIVADFIAFHNANTHLRAVSNLANLSLLRRTVTH